MRNQVKDWLPRWWQILPLTVLLLIYTIGAIADGNSVTNVLSQMVNFVLAVVVLYIALCIFLITLKFLLRLIRALLIYTLDFINEQETKIK